MMAPSNTRRRDQAGGCLMILLGLGAVAQSSQYRLGTLDRLGPGFFPTVLGALLTAVGAGILAVAKPVLAETGEAKRPPEWIAWACIVASLIAFVVLGTYGGLAPATFAIVFIAALGDRGNTVKHALVLASAVLAVCVIVFWWLLQLQFPLFSWG